MAQAPAQQVDVAAQMKKFFHLTGEQLRRQSTSSPRENRTPTFKSVGVLSVGMDRKQVIAIVLAGLMLLSSVGAVASII